MNISPIAPYVSRAPLLPNRFTRKLALSVVKNQSQLKNDAAKDTIPADRNINCTMLCSIILIYCLLLEPIPGP